ncbi:hypothetical protein CASFOL_041715 [Castilleja foliolosa]|uniref:Uncharacterized protein n=1 Tax=Castilleja foliolosa TaxID=1961234 RepID=A0ABD3B8G5_9LAMI
MRCKKHPTDLSSSVGVCAACLRERLLTVMAAQAQAHIRAQAQQDCRKSHNSQQPTPLSFPRSVSPYISRRKSDTGAATWQQSHHQQRFHSTPQVGPTQLEMGRDKTTKSSRGGRMLSSLFLGFFRSKSDKPGLDTGRDPGIPADTCSASPSWFSAIIRRRRKKQNRGFWMDEGPTGRNSGFNRDHGMSPARYTNDEDSHGGLSGYSSEMSQGWRQTPSRTPVATRRGGERGYGHSRNVSGLGFCLSPLVRPSPNRNWNQKGMPPEVVVAGESTAASFCKNRSPKLADFGRYSNH